MSEEVLGDYWESILWRNRVYNQKEHMSNNVHECCSADIRAHIWEPVRDLMLGLAGSTERAVETLNA